MFGGIDIDLSQAQPAEQAIRLELNAVFGSIRLKVPEGWRLEHDDTIIFGSVHRAPPATSEGGSAVKLEANSIFGSIEVVR